MLTYLTSRGLSDSQRAAAALGLGIGTVGQVIDWKASLMFLAPVTMQGGMVAFRIVSNNDVEGRPICSEMWSGNTTDAKTAAGH